MYLIFSFFFFLLKYIADDMGLGKTLTMISLIMATLGQEDNDSDDEWHTTNKSISM